MSGYTVLATRYRPRVFDDVVGQEDVGRVLQGALREGRAAHAFLFSGPRGVGKTSMARILAKAFNCLENELGEPCGHCSICEGIDTGSEVFDVEEIDGASHNRVENVRELIERLRFAPTIARHRITIVDEVHMLSTAAFNALLKTLEEPPAHAKFILATTEPLKVPETIRSRCQMLDFRRLGANTIAQRLAHVCESERVVAPEGLLGRIARHAQGGLRDALTLLDQLITMGDGAPQLEHFERLTGQLSSESLQGLLAACLSSDVGAVHAWAEAAVSRGARPADLLAQIVDWLEGLLVTCAGGRPADRADEEVSALAELGKAANVDHVIAMIDVILEAQQRLRQRHEGRLVLEMALITLARLAQLTSVTELLAGGVAPSALAPPAAKPVPPAAKPAPPAAKPVPPAAKPVPPAAKPVPPAAKPAPPAAKPAPPAAKPTPAAAKPAAPAATQPQSVAPAPAEDFRSRFLAAISSRSLRLELLRYAKLELEGTCLRLTPPGEGPPLLHDPSSTKVRGLLQAAANAAAGREVKLDLADSTPAPSAGREAGAAASGSPAEAPPKKRSGNSRGPVDDAVRELWPEAEDVDG